MEEIASQLTHLVFVLTRFNRGCKLTGKGMAELCQIQL